MIVIIFLLKYKKKEKIYSKGFKVSDDFWWNYDIINDIDNLSIEFKYWFMLVDFFVIKFIN